MSFLLCTSQDRSIGTRNMCKLTSHCVLGRSQTSSAFPSPSYFLVLGILISDQVSQNLTNLVSPAFSMKQFPAAVDGFAERHDTVNNASSHLKTTNEQGESVAIGFARPQSSLVSWLLLVEQSHSEAYSPIERLRTIVLACVLGTVGLVLAIVLPIVHYSVRPIRRLRDATEKSMAPPGYTPNGSMRSDVDDREIFIDGVDESEHGNSSPPHSKKGVLVRLRQLTSNGRRKSHLERKEVETRRVFKIPGKVRDRKHYITDELTELTGKFLELHG